MARVFGFREFACTEDRRCSLCWRAVQRAVGRRHQKIAFLRPPREAIALPTPPPEADAEISMACNLQWNAAESSSVWTTYLAKIKLKERSTKI